MRFTGLGAAFGWALWCAACSDGNAAARVSADRLVLEVGGAHASLRSALTAAGVTPGAPRPVRSGEPVVEVPAVEHAPPKSESPAPTPDPQPQPRPDPKQPDAPPAEPDHIIVTLGERQTLIHLAKKHLGDANRFREILTLNGWSEADSRRLLPGQKVKIPRPSARSPRR